VPTLLQKSKVFGEILKLGSFLGPLFVFFVSKASPRTLLPEENYLSPRAQGMGGVSVGVSSDGDAVLSNPAGIGAEDAGNSKRILKGLTLPNLTVGLNKETIQLVKAYRSAANSSASIEKTILEGSEHKSLFGYVSLFPYVTISRFQLGILVSSWGQGNVTTLKSPEKSRFSTPSKPQSYDKILEVYSISQTMGVLGFSMPYGASGFALGVTTRAGFRSSLIQTFEANDGVAQKSSETIKASTNTTKGLGVDVGMLYQSSKTSLRPKMGLTIKDISDTSYKPLKSDGVREIDKMSFSLGGSLNPKFGSLGNMAAGIDVQRIEDSRIEWVRKAHAGLEFSFLGTESDPVFALRTGFNGDGLTAGGSVDLTFFKICGAWYSKAVSSFSDPQASKPVDQRFLLNLTIDLRT
jgi:hypothetical protein